MVANRAHGKLRIAALCVSASTIGDPRAFIDNSRHRYRLDKDMTISEGGELEMDHSGDAPARILMQPLTPQRPLTQVEQTPILKYAASVERQLPILHCDFDAPPVRKHSKPWPELKAHIFYVGACDKGRWMRKSSVFGNRGPDPDI